MTAQTVNAQLMQTLNFSAADLAANRKGKVTDAQRERLKILVAQGTNIGIRVAGFVILIVVAVIVYIVLGSQGVVPLPEEVFGSNALLIVAVMSIVMVFYVIMLVVAFSRSRQMASGNVSVRSLTGKVKVSARGMSAYSTASVVGRAAGAPTVSYILQVGREKIYTADEAVYRAFQDGMSYRVYVVGTKPSYIVLSAEAVST